MGGGKQLQSQSPYLGSGQTASFENMLSSCSQDPACNVFSQPPILKCTYNSLVVVQSARGMWSLPTKNLSFGGGRYVCKYLITVQHGNAP